MGARTMAGNSKPEIDALLVEVLRKPEAERPAFLDLLCRDDDRLRKLAGELANGPVPVLPLDSPVEVEAIFEIRG